MKNVIVYSFKGYDTAKHHYILRPAKATLERIRRIGALGGHKERQAIRVFECVIGTARAGLPDGGI